MQSAVYATEVSTEEYLCYTTEEREKMEVMARAEKLGGDIQAAILLMHGSASISPACSASPASASPN